MGAVMTRGRSREVDSEDCNRALLLCARQRTCGLEASPRHLQSAAAHRLERTTRTNWAAATRSISWTSGHIPETAKLPSMKDAQPRTRSARHTHSCHRLAAAQALDCF